MFNFIKARIKDVCIMFDFIKCVWAIHRIFKFEEAGFSISRKVFRREKLKNWFKSTFETKKTRAARLAKEEEKRKQMEKEYEEQMKASNERLALLLLLDSMGNEDAMNAACDIIKQGELVEGYK